MSDKHKGIDISSHQGTINWAAVKNAGIEFAIIRCGYGENLTTQDDKTFITNIKACVAAGIPIGIYLYSYALTLAGVISEVAHVKRLVAVMEALGASPDLGIFYDMEDAAQTKYGGIGYKAYNGVPLNKANGALYTSMCKKFCSDLESLGYPVGVYASYSVFKSILTTSQLSNYKLWIARWSTVEPTGYTNMIGWQYADDGTVSGISGNVDMDYYYGDLDGEDSSSTVTTTSSSNEMTISEFQTWLNKNFGDYIKKCKRCGYELLEIDNEFGFKTQSAAVVAWQVTCNRQFNAGLKVDGWFGAASKKFGDEALVKFGVSGIFVTILEGCLRSADMYDGRMDDVAGAKVKTGIGEYQDSKSNLSKDWECGPETWYDILNRFSA